MHIDSERQARIAAFDAFVAARSGQLLRLGAALAGDWHRGEDLVQAALLKVYLALDDVRDLGALPALTRTTMTRQALSWRRRRWQAEWPADELPERAAPDTVQSVLDDDAVVRLLGTLPARQRAAVWLRHVEDLPEAEVARLMGCSVGSVKTHAHRGLATLRARLDPAATPAGLPTAPSGDLP